MSTGTSFVERLRARNPLPHGTVVVGGGFLVAGLTIYAFLAISARALGPEAYAPLSVLWAITFLAAPGFYFPVEQEVGRALSDRRARGLGGGPVIKRAAMLAGIFVAVLTLAAVAASAPLLDQFFDDQILLLVGFVVALAAYALEHLVRGSLSGNDRFATYGIVIGAEGVVRLLGCIVLAVAGVATAGPYGMVVGVAPAIAVLFAAGREEGLLTEGPEAPWNELTRALWYLLIGQVLAQTLINITPLAVNLFAGPGEEEEVGKVLIALIVARIPVFMFQAVQASLIPQIAGLAAAGKHDELRVRLMRLLGAVLAVAAAFTVVAAVLGPTVIRLFFGSEFELGGGDLAYLAGASGLYMVALAQAQALIALIGYRRAALGWLVGVAVFFALAAVPADTVFRAERAFFGGSTAAAVAMTALLLPVVPGRQSEPAG